MLRKTKRWRSGWPRPENGGSRHRDDREQQAGWPISLRHRPVIPTQDSEGAQGGPAAGASDFGLHLQRNTFAMKQVEWPAAVLVAALDYDLDGLTNTFVGLDSGIPQIIEST